MKLVRATGVRVVEETSKDNLKDVKTRVYNSRSDRITTTTGYAFTGSNDPLAPKKITPIVVDTPVELA